MTMSSDTAVVSTAASSIRVLLVDDSAVIRGFLRRFIEEDPDLRVVGSVSDGQRALDMLRKTEVDVVVLDIEMPVMDGLTALPHIFAIDPSLQVIIASTLTKENAVLTMKCLKAGAAECLAKPTARELSASEDFRKSLVEKVRTLGLVTRRKRGKPAAIPATPGAPAAPAVAAPVRPEKKFTLRPQGVKIAPAVIAIGSSTGGPQALMHLFTEIKAPLKQPVFITQHMPPTFTTILAEHISRQSGLTCREAVHGEIVQGGVIYLAPGNWHLTVEEEGGVRKVSLNQAPPENFCRPAVDPMLRSLVKVYGRKVLAVVLTGMGSDGMKGCQEVVDAGGVVLAQDETTCVVWGMPGAVATAGLCTQVLPLGLMAGEIRDYADRVVSA